MLYTYSFQNKKRDLSDVLSTVIAGEPRFISNFRDLGIAKQRKYEWLEDQITGRSIVATEVSSLDLTVSAGDAAKVKVGTLLTVKDDSALFRVTEVTGTKVKVELVAQNGSDTTTPKANDVLNIVSTPMAEGSGNGDGEEDYHFTGTDYNVCQIFRKEIVLTGSALAIDVYGNADNQLQRQTAFALSQLSYDLNRVVLFGHRREATAAIRGEAGGLYDFGTQPGGLLIDAQGATLDSYIVNDGAQAVMGAGGEPLQILCSPGQARVLSAEFKDRLQILRADNTRGAYVAVLVNEISGRGMTIMADPEVPDTDVWVIDPAGFGMVALNGRGITDQDATPNGFDGIRRVALGELTFVFKNAKQRLCRIKGLKGSAAALVGIKSGRGMITVANSDENPIPTKAVEV